MCFPVAKLPPWNLPARSMSLSWRYWNLSSARESRPRPQSSTESWFTLKLLMSKLLEGKHALILGIANKWSLAYAIAQAFSREGAALTLTYLGERQKDSIVELTKDLNVVATLPCDVTKDDELAALTESLKAMNRPVHA